MAISKVILNGNTLMDTTDKTVTAANLLSGYTALKNDGTTVTGEYVAPTPSLQSKTVSPSTSQQTVSPDSGYDGLSSVTVNAVPSGSATTPATTITANPTISVGANGLITASVSKTQGVTPSVTAGYVASGTSGTITVNGSNTKQLTAKSAQTYTPTTTDQTIASGQYLIGTQTVKGDANLLAENIKKDVVLFGITGTYEGSGGGSVNILTLYTDNNCTALWADSAHTTSVLEAYDYDYSAVYAAFDNADTIKVIGSVNKRHYVIYFNYKSADDDFVVAIADNTTIKDIYL